MMTYTDKRGVVHYASSRFTGWTRCHRRTESAIEHGSTKIPTCFWCVLLRITSLW